MKGDDGTPHKRGTSEKMYECDSKQAKRLVAFLVEAHVKVLQSSSIVLRVWV